MKIKDQIKLLHQYQKQYPSGTPDTILDSILDEYYACPKCKGKGSENKGEISCFQESDIRYESKNVTCNLCKGEGFTKEKYKKVPKEYDYVLESD